jgi:hypothetical protein
MLNHGSNNHNENQVDLKFVRDKIQTLSEKLEAITKISNITKTLLKHKITSYNDSEYINCSYDRRILQDNKYIIHSLLFQALGKSIKQKDYIEVIHNDNFKKNTSIKEPTNNDLKKIAKQIYIFDYIISYDIYLHHEAYILTRISDESCKDLVTPQLEYSDYQFYGRDLYFLYELQYIDYQSYISSNKNSIKLLQTITRYYQSTITKLKEYTNEISQLLIILKQQLEIPSLTLIQSPNHLYSSTKGLKQNKKLIDFATQSSDFAVIKLLFKNIAPEIYVELEKEIAAEDKRNAIQSYITQNSEEIIDYISGEKLKKTEDIIFSAFRALAIKAFQLQEVDSPDRKITVKTSDFFRLCNLKNRKEGGYDTNQKTKIKELLKQESNLLKPIFYENGKSFVVTSFIKYLYWNNDNTITFEIDSMFFVNKEDGLSFFCEDIEGRNRLTSEMPNSDPAYKLHKYFSYALKSPTQEFNVTLLLQKSGLIESYNKGQRKRALDDLQKILNTMFEVNTITKDKPIRIASASDNLGKYKIVNSRYKEIKAIEQQSKKERKKSKLKLIVENTNK